MSRIVGALLVAASAALGHVGPAAADAAADKAQALCENAVVVGARRGGVPESVLHAIALTETGRKVGGSFRPWPWAINREGVGHWFDTREEALAFAKASVAEGRTSFDVGCFQINYHWHGDAFELLEAMFDQSTNGTYAAQFLRELHAELGSWSAAAGAYHSRTPEFALRYRARFDRILASLDGTQLEYAALAPDEGAEADSQARPKRSRTRIGGKPKIISLNPSGAVAATPARTIRVERGKLPPSLAKAEEPAAPAEVPEGAAAAPAGPIVLSARNEI